MSEGKRPGGLTALAVINFIFGGFGALGLLALVAFFAILSGAAPEDQATIELKGALEEMGKGMLVVMLVLGVISTVLMIASGVGYLKQKKFLGRTLGNAYAGLALVQSGISAAMVDPLAGGGFNIETMIGLIYPVLTLLLLNTTFKEDFSE